MSRHFKALVYVDRADDFVTDAEDIEMMNARLAGSIYLIRPMDNVWERLEQLAEQVIAVNQKVTARRDADDSSPNAALDRMRIDLAQMIRERDALKRDLAAVTAKYEKLSDKIGGEITGDAPKPAPRKARKK